MQALNVLIVDDSVAIRKILRRMLKGQGLPVGEVYEAEHGADALEKLKDQKVQLILSDINMPVMDGIQLLTEVKANNELKHIPMVMITTEGGEAKVVEALKLGASAYIRKPFTPEQISQQLSNLV